MSVDSGAKAIVCSPLEISAIRSAVMLSQNKRIDVLPLDRKQLESVARLLNYPRGGAGELEQDYLATTRRARVVFEKLFYD
jgi:glutamate-ammonia-ligase adenylyltransferase